MKKLLLSAAIFHSFFLVNAQAPEDVLRYSYFPNTGSARNMAIGGAMGSLGGDISALYMNPAGLGLYKTSEFVITPGVRMNNNKFSYRDTYSNSSKSGFGLGTSGFVFGFGNPYSKWTSQAISIGINQTASFNNRLSYSGRNNMSSYAEMFTEEISNSRLSFNEILNRQGGQFAYGSAPAIYTYLVDTFRNSSNGLDVRALPEFLLDKGIALNQQKTITTTGGINELALGYAANMDDRFYWGATVGIPLVKYERNTVYRESDPSGDKNNNFDFFELRDKLTTSGAGVNLKLGLIVKPQEFVRIGFAVHSPTFYSLTDKETAYLDANTEAYNGNITARDSSTRYTNGKEGVTKYGATSPWKAIVSGSYVFRETSDTRKQRAFVTADVEYVGYPSGSFTDDSKFGYNSDYYSELKSVIKDYYKGAFNFRLGGELKFNTWMFRAGGAYYGNPYRQNDVLKANKIVASGGIGYRDQGMFIDLTYAHNFNKDVNFPYRLQDKANTFAEQSGGTGNLMLTLGFKL